MVICTNCGFQNQPGDEFCGNCGRYLEFSGAEAAGQGAADAGAGGTTGASAGAGGAGGAAGTAGTAGAAGAAAGSDAPTNVGGSPVGAGPVGGGAAGGGAVGSGAVGAGPAVRGGAPDVICWNCGRRNPPGRAFCMQCGTKLTTEAGAAGAARAAGAGGAAGMAGAAGAGGTAAGVGYGAGYGAGGRGRPVDGGGDGGGGGTRLAAILVGALAILVLLGLGAVALGLFAGPPGPSGVAVISPSPSASLAASGLASGSPLTSPLTSPSLGSSFDVPTVVPPTGVVVVTPSPTIEPPSTPEPTRRPRCDANGQPPGCRPTRPPATPTTEPTPTAAPTPLDCSLATGTPNMFSLTVEAPTRQVPSQFAWCIRDVTFTNLSNPGATGTLKVYLENDEFVGPPGNYGMARIGWPGDGGACEASIDFNFTGSSTYSPTCTYPNGYAYMPPGTLLDFEIDNCGTNGTCNGYVTIRFERVPAPPPPQP